MPELFFGPGLFLGFAVLGTAVPFFIILLIVVFLLRAPTPDRRGRRPYATYLFSVIFVSLFTALAGLGLLGAAIAEAATGTGPAVSVSCSTGTTVPLAPQFTIPPFATPFPFPSFSRLPIPSFPSAFPRFSPFPRPTFRF